MVLGLHCQRAKPGAEKRAQRWLTARSTMVDKSFPLTLFRKDAVADQPGLPSLRMKLNPESKMASGCSRPKVTWFEEIVHLPRIARLARPLGEGCR